MSYVLGIYAGHGGTACLLKDGKIIACVQEEKFKRIKNYPGMPVESIKYCLKYAGISSLDIDLVSFSTYGVAGECVGRETYSFLSKLREKTICKFKKLDNFIYNKIAPFLGKISQKNRLELLERNFKIPSNRIIFVDHHTCHAYAALFSSPFVNQNKDILTITLDGAGDLLSGTIGIWKNKKFQVIAKTYICDSLGWLYEGTTKYLGMKPQEHEYKVMGLAPYASEEGKRKCYQIVKDLYKVEDDLTIKSKYHAIRYWNTEVLRKLFKNLRFDYIAGGVQLLVENIICELVGKAIEKTGINTIVCGGGVFMNVKANMLLAKMPQVKEIFVMPTASDESTAIGAAYYGALLLNSEKICNIRHLYWGPEYSDQEIEKVIKKFKSAHNINIKKYDDITKEIAKLLARGEIVARVNGRMEWGARALGNRSILADASNIEVVEKINKMIKKRDFWMPFAPTILDTDIARYLDDLKNFKKINSEYMIFA